MIKFKKDQVIISRNLILPFDECSFYEIDSDVNYATEVSNNIIFYQKDVKLYIDMLSTNKFLTKLKLAFKYLRSK